MSTESLNCPNCGASLQVDPDADVVICSYCNSSIRIKKSETSTKLFIEDTENTDISGEILEEIKRLLQNGQKIEAIKVYRSNTNKSLKQAKQDVESIAEKYNINIKSSAASTSSCITLVILILVFPFIIGIIVVIVGELMKHFYGQSMTPKTVNQIQALTGASIIVLSILFFIIWVYRSNKKRKRDD
jgi:ATP-dependent Zn protease